MSLMASYGRGSYKGPLILPRPSNPGLPSLGAVSSSSSSSSAAGTGRSQALKVHSQAEKRRRERINDHLSTLRRMVPDANKMDKAALLGKVIDHVKDLKRKASSIGNGFSIPAESNEVTVESKEFDATTTSDTKNFYIKASISCDDRPDLFTSLMKAFHGLRLRTVRADITSLGGRVQNVFVLCGRRENGNGSGVNLSSLKESVKDALARIASFDVVAMDASSIKRQRLLQSYYSRVSI